jgi:hypothetical protein
MLWGFFRRFGKRKRRIVAIPRPDFDRGEMCHA